MEILWDYVFNKKLELPKEQLGDRQLIMTEAPNNPDRNKEVMAEILFEKLRIRYFDIESLAKLTFFAEDEDTGFVLDNGDGVTHVIPIYKKYLLIHQIKRLDY